MNEKSNVTERSVAASGSLDWMDLPNDVGWFWKATRVGNDGEVVAVFVDHVLLRQYRAIGDMRGNGVAIKYHPMESPTNPLFQ